RGSHGRGDRLPTPQHLLPDREGAARMSGQREQPTPVAAIDQQRRSWPARRPKGGVAGRQTESP
ncbi:MAG: hypothetical protein ACK56F_17185, partial [bacterium]